MAGFHYEIYRPAATQPDWSTALSCGLKDSSIMISTPKVISDADNVLCALSRLSSVIPHIYNSVLVAKKIAPSP